MRLEPILKPDLTFQIENAADRDDVLKRLADSAAAFTSNHSAEVLFNALLERESQTATCTPEGVAFPHALLPDVDETLLIVARLKPAVSFTTTDMPAPDLIFCMIGSTEKPWEHVRLLARLARVARGQGALDRIRTAESASDMYTVLLEEDRAHG
jgi:PTS system nitrogen regulatory IIA component